MISLLTSSKTMDFNQPAPNFVSPTNLLFPEEAKTIQARLACYSSDALAKLMNISSQLSTNVTGLYTEPSGKRKPAIYAYRGDVYRGFGADSLDRGDMDWANRHILIPSGLYGLVRPYDEIEQYRLEMKTKLELDKQKSLYGFWGDKLAKYVESMDDTVLVLASNEYAKAVVPKLSADIRVVEVHFKDRAKNGHIKTVPIYSKIMRGVMARYIVKNRVNDTASLRDFAEQGYVFDEAQSADNKLVFYRDKPAVIAV
ncbi:MAG: YaaA family protein [bacterium]|nr:YaaA family protein [bacterium]MDN5835360.1 YaaA family protein [bacterium]